MSASPTRSWSLQGVRTALCILGIAALPAVSAAPALFQAASAGASYTFVDPATPAVVNGQGKVDGTVAGVGCIGPNGPFCLTSGLVEGTQPNWWYHGGPTTWTPYSAAAQAVSEFGGAHVRARVTTFNGVPAPGDLGAERYSARADAGFREDITFLAAAPAQVTFYARLQGQWSDRGLLSARAGIVVTPPDDVEQLIGDAYYTHPFFLGGKPTSNEHWLGVDPIAGSIDELLRFDMVLTPLGWVPPNPDGEDENTPFTTNPFEMGLTATTNSSGAAVDFFHSLILEQVVIPVGTSIAFSSGTNYRVSTAAGPTAVPEPAALLLLLTALAGMRPWRGRASRRR